MAQQSSGIGSCKQSLSGAVQSRTEAAPTPPLLDLQGEHERHRMKVNPDILPGGKRYRSFRWELFAVNLAWIAILVVLLVTLWHK